jgi:GcrA cell cycle regulator
MTNRRDLWPPERDEALREKWTAGKFTSQIARELGTTKNAVIGRGRRIGLEGRASPIIRNPDAPAKPRAPQIARAAPTTLKVLASITDTLGTRISSAPQLSHASCCWPLWGMGRPTHVYCGANAVLGRPYCPTHARVAYSENRRDL